MFDINLYKDHLNKSSFGEILYFPKLESTNSKALELSKSDAPNGTIVITDNQTTGRGRRDNKWSSVVGNSLTFSTIVYPDCSIDQINRYSIITGLSVSDSIIELGLSPSLKWPNDVQINSKKISGILIESKLNGNSIRMLVIGIGLNVNEYTSDFPEHLQETSTSVSIEKGHPENREKILASIVNNLDKRLSDLDNFAFQLQEWENRCGHMNIGVEFHLNDKIISGIFKGLTELGLARIDINGDEQIFNSGELVTP